MPKKVTHIRHLRSTATALAKEWHTLFIAAGGKAMARRAIYGSLVWDGVQQCYVARMTVSGEEPLRYRKWTVRLKSDGTLIDAKHEA